MYCKIKIQSTIFCLWFSIASLAAQPNASVTGVTFNKTQIIRGIETLSASIVIKNTGTTTGIFYVTASSQDLGGFWYDFVPTRLAKSINAGKSDSVTLTWLPGANVTVGNCYFYTKIFKSTSGSDYYTDYGKSAAYIILPNPNPLPIINGRIAYHIDSDNQSLHTPKNSSDGNIFIYDFSKNTSPQNITSKFNIGNAMNPNFNPDGSKLTFMAIPKGEGLTWTNMRAYLYDFVKDTILMLGYGQDPKFSPVNSTIVIKQNGDIKIIDFDGVVVSTITNDGFTNEESMPFFTHDGQKIIFARGAKTNSDIYIVNIDGTNYQPMVQTSNLLEYYPIGIDANTFLYTRSLSLSDLHDQIYIGYYNGNAPQAAKFNSPNFDCSDPFPGPTPYSFFSMNSNNGYDLFLGNLLTGNTWNLDSLAINTSFNELGLCYSDEMLTKVENEISAASTVSIFPNPEYNLFIFSFGKNRFNKLELYNAFGQLILYSNLNQYDATYKMDLSSYPSGIYFAKLISNNGDLVKKLVNR